MPLRMKMNRTAYICAELHDSSLWKTVHQKIGSVVEEFRGEITDSGYLFENFKIKAVFSHRRLKALEKAVNNALAGLPVRAVAVWPTDPFKLRKNRAA